MFHVYLANKKIKESKETQRTPAEILTDIHRGLTEFAATLIPCTFGSGNNISFSYTCYFGLLEPRPIDSFNDLKHLLKQIKAWHERISTNESLEKFKAELATFLENEHDYPGIRSFIQERTDFPQVIAPLITKLVYDFATYQNTLHILLDVDLKSFMDIKKILRPKIAEHKRVEGVAPPLESLTLSAYDEMFNKKHTEIYTSLKLNEKNSSERKLSR